MVCKRILESTVAICTTAAALFGKLFMVAANSPRPLRGGRERRLWASQAGTAVSCHGSNAIPAVTADVVLELSADTAAQLIYAKFRRWPMRHALHALPSSIACSHCAEQGGQCLFTMLVRHSRDLHQCRGFCAKPWQGL